jgi:hypothetical protein
MQNIKYILIFLSIILFSVPLYSQAILEADGPGSTYELITNVFAPGRDTTAVEDPQCIHPSFGRHIAEVWDTNLSQYVFEFYIHVTPDNDRCIMLDRQRVEIKTYDASPDSLKGVTGETITYKWKFKLPVGFQPSTSFTHIHQIKAVGGNDGDPIFTLTPRKGSPNKLELIHDNTTKVAIVDLSSFEGVWVECKEVVYIDSIKGRYSLTIKKVSDGTTLLSYSNNQIMTIRSDNTFIRPKWGLYRSLDHPTDLRDEAMRFAGFYIGEGSTITTAGSGNWSSTTANTPWPWGTSPSSSDTVVIAAGHTITLDQNAAVNSLTINNGATLSTTLADSTRSLNGNITINGNFNVSGGYKLNTNGNIICFGSSAALKFGSNGGKLSSASPKTFTLSNGATLGTAINSTTGDVVQLSLANLALVVINSPALTTIEYKNSGNSWVTILPNNQVYGNLRFTTSSSTAGRTITLKNNLSILGSLTWAPTSTTTGINVWDFGPYKISHAGSGTAVTVSQASSTNQIQITGTGADLFSGFTSYNFVAPSNTNCLVNYASTTGTQNVVGGTYNNLTISGGSIKSLSGPLTVDTLTLTSGKLALGSNNLTLGPSSIISGTPSAANMVVSEGTGELRKQISSAPTLPYSFTFPVGDNNGTAEYSPIRLSFTNGIFSSAYVGVKLKNQKHTSNGSTTNYINRYWTISASGISSFSCNADFVYSDGDIVGTESNLTLGKYNGSIWDVVGYVNPTINTLSALGLTSFSDFTGGESAALPVQITSFVGNYVGSGVKLEWQTISEVNNYGFNVQRQSGDRFTTIGFVAGKGTTMEPQSYSFIDNQPGNSYRLEQIDNNGLKNYYGPILLNPNSVDNYVPAVFKLNQNYPNPFNPTTNISFSLGNSGHTTLKVYNMLGNEVATLFNGNGEAGKLYTVKFDGINLSTGMYIYKLQNGNSVEVRKLVLVK